MDSLARFLARQPHVASVVPEATTFDIRDITVPRARATATEGASEATIEPRRVSLEGSEALHPDAASTAICRQATYEARAARSRRDPPGVATAAA
jgi:hypothetical protein